MPARIHTDERTRELCGVIHQLIATKGLAGVSYRSVASAVGISPSALHDHFPDMTYLIKLAAHHLADDRLARFGNGGIRDGLVSERLVSERLVSERLVSERLVPEGLVPEGLAAVLPESDREVEDSVAWSAYRQLARTEPMLGYVMTQARLAELALIRRTLVAGGGSAADSDADSDADNDADRAEIVLALLEGLESACTLGEEPMTHARAVALLGAALAALVPGDRPAA